MARVAVLADRYGLSLSTASPVARDAYVEGADCILSAVAGAEAYLARALEADPEFALAHIALARALFLTAQVPQARTAAARARELASRATPREQSHVNAIALAIEGKPPDALVATREHVALFPLQLTILPSASSWSASCESAWPPANCRQAKLSRRWPMRSGHSPEATGIMQLRCSSRRSRRRYASAAVVHSAISSSTRWSPRISGRAEPMMRAK